MSVEDEQQRQIELGLELRNQVYAEIERQAEIAASLSRSIAEAAFRGDQLTVGVHVKQLRLVVLSLIKLHKEGLVDQNLAERGRSEGRAGGDQQAGDGVGDARSS